MNALSRSAASAAVRTVETPMPRRVVHSSVTMVEGLRKAENGRIISNSDVDALSQLERKQIGTLFFPPRNGELMGRILSSKRLCYTGTVFGYKGPGKELGNAISYRNGGIEYVFPVPVEFREMINTAVVAEHPEFVVEERITKTSHGIIITADNVKAVRAIPDDSGGPFFGDKEHGIPVRVSNPDFDVRKTRNIARAWEMVSLVVRSIGERKPEVDTVMMHYPPSCSFDMVIDH